MLIAGSIIVAALILEHGISSAISRLTRSIDLFLKEKKGNGNE